MSEAKNSSRLSLTVEGGRAPKEKAENENAFRNRRSCIEGTTQQPYSSSSRKQARSRESLEHNVFSSHVR